MVLSLIAGALGANASRKAANVQAQAARDAAQTALQGTRESNALLEDFRRRDEARFQPFYGGGLDAYNALRFEMGLGGRPTVGGTTTPLSIETFTETVPGRSGGGGSFNPVASFFGVSPSSGGSAGQPQSTTRFRVGGNVFNTMEEAQAYANQNATTTGGTEYGGFKATPGYQFRMGEGMRAVESGVAARQGLNSGAALESLMRAGQEFGSNEYANFFQRLAGLAQGGMDAAGMQSNSALNFGTQMGQNINAGANAGAQGIAGAGNAGAAGIMGANNSWQNAIGNAAGGWQMNNMLRAFQPQASGQTAPTQPAWSRWIF